MAKALEIVLKPVRVRLKFFTGIRDFLRDAVRREPFGWGSLVVSFVFGIFMAGAAALTIIFGLHTHQLLGYTRRSGEMSDTGKFITSLMVGLVLGMPIGGFVWGRTGKFRWPLAALLSFLTGFALVYVRWL